MDYFYISPEKVLHGVITIGGDESKHIVRVLRKKSGDRIYITDGNDTMYEAVITEFGKKDVQCEIAAIHRKYNEPSIEVTLAVSLLKNPARFDFLVEKTTELGVRTIIPLRCQRTIPRSEKHDRLEKLALSAMKQCGRSWLPRVKEVQTFDELIGNSQHWMAKLIPHEKADPSQTISSELKHFDDVRSFLIAIGPEGGFTEEETSNALKAGFKPVSLGMRRLRSETASIVAMAELLRRG